MDTRQVRFRLRQDTEANFQMRNRVYLEGEPLCVLSPSGGMRMKIGDGLRAYNDLPFVLTPDGDIPSIGDLADLTTDAKDTIVNAINELNAAGVSFDLLYANAKAG